MKLNLLFICCLFLNITGLALANQSPETISIIPIPAEMEIGSGYFAVNANTSIKAQSELEQYKELLGGYLAPSGYALKSVHKNGNIIVLELDSNLDYLGQEGYFLEVNPDKIIIKAPYKKGVFYGIQTLRQLLPVDISTSGKADELWHIPALKITDKPEFQWRGLMIDCSRTFWSKDFLKKYIDLLALYKMNILHLHLTDDQGWRLEIKSYPDLTEISSKFDVKYNEPPEREGFYSQADMLELIHYASLRNITIVPEIEMPGHSVAVFAAYPELSCCGTKAEIFPFFKGPNITSQIYCAGNEQTFEFLEKVLSEVIELFPTEYVHIGADEVPKTAWKNCVKCQEKIKALGLKDEYELQSYFIKRIEKFLNAKGKKLIGWDEILEGGLAPNATVMSWRGTSGGIAAAQAGHNVIMSPTSHCYFDYSYESISTEKAYSFNPVPAQLSAQQQKHILGLQANFWSHIDRSEESMNRQIFPRLCALAEVGWSPADKRNWQEFSGRLKPHLNRLKSMGVQYYREFDGLLGQWKPEQMSEAYKVLEWNIGRQITDKGKYSIVFRYSGGAHRLGIQWVALLADGQEIARVSHYGQAGTLHENNIYHFVLDTLPQNANYSIKASIRSEGGIDSRGNVYINKE